MMAVVVVAGLVSLVGPVEDTVDIVAVEWLVPPADGMIVAAEMPAAAPLAQFVDGMTVAVVMVVAVVVAGVAAAAEIAAAVAAVFFAADGAKVAAVVVVVVAAKFVAAAAVAMVEVVVGMAVGLVLLAD